MRRLFCLIGLLPVAVAAGCSPRAQTATPPASSAKAGRLLLQSRAFARNARIPTKYTGDGANNSPPLNWQGVPSDPQHGAKSLAIICRDSNANFSHWLIWNLPPAGSNLPEALPKSGELFNNARQGLNDFKTLGYAGPKPPRGQTHVYTFELFALDSVLSLPAGSNEAALRAAINGHVLAQGQLSGRYGE